MLTTEIMQNEEKTKEDRIRDLKEIEELRIKNPSCTIINMVTFPRSASGTGIRYVHNIIDRGYQVKIRMNGFKHFVNWLTLINTEDFTLKDSGLGVGYQSEFFDNINKIEQYLYSFIKYHIKENIECGCFKTLPQGIIKLPKNNE